MTCPFNAKHEMPKPELRHHLTHCPDKAMLEPELKYGKSARPVDKRFHNFRLGAFFFYLKSTNIFLISAQKMCCGYSLEAPHRGAFNEYLHVFVQK